MKSLWILAWWFDKKHHEVVTSDSGKLWWTEQLIDLWFWLGGLIDKWWMEKLSSFSSMPSILYQMPSAFVNLLRKQTNKHTNKQTGRLRDASMSIITLNAPPPSPPPGQLKMESTGASSPRASTSWWPRPRATPEPWRKSTCLLACPRRAGWTLSCRKLLPSPTCRRRTTPSRLWAPTTASTLTTSTSATPWWQIWARTARREQRSPGGGTTLSCPEDRHRPGCSNNIRALMRRIIISLKLSFHVTNVLQSVKS